MRVYKKVPDSFSKYQIINSSDSLDNNRKGITHEIIKKKNRKHECVDMLQENADQNQLLLSPLWLHQLTSVVWWKTEKIWEYNSIMSSIQDKQFSKRYPTNILRYTILPVQGFFKAIRVDIEVVVGVFRWCESICTASMLKRRMGDIQNMLWSSWKVSIWRKNKRYHRDTISFIYQIKARNGKQEKQRTI